MDLPGVGVKVIAMVAVFGKKRNHSGAPSPRAGSSTVESASLRTEPSPPPWAAGFFLPHTLPSGSSSLWRPTHCGVQCSTPLRLELHQPDFSKS